MLTLPRNRPRGFDVDAARRLNLEPARRTVTRVPVRPYLIFATAVAGVAVTGLFDYVTGYEVRVFPIYFLPVALAAWKLSRRAALAIAALSTVAWGVANAMAGRAYGDPLVWPINLTTQFVAFATVGVLVAELQHRLRYERELSRVDALTGLANSRAFYERGEIFVALARRARRPITIAYLDLDNFKAINDDRGHHEGDRTLARTAAILRSTCRTTDLIARLGGDEFALLLPDTGADAAMIALGRVHAAIGGMMREHGHPCAVSIGAISYRCAPPTLEAAVHDADALMYRAKAGGKDRVVLERIEGDEAAAPAVD